MIFPDLRALDTHIKAGALLPVYLLMFLVLMVWMHERLERKTRRE